MFNRMFPGRSCSPLLGVVVRYQLRVVPPLPGVPLTRKQLWREHARFSAAAKLTQNDFLLRLYPMRKIRYSSIIILLGRTLSSRPYVQYK